PLPSPECFDAVAVAKELQCFGLHLGCRHTFTALAPFAAYVIHAGESTPAAHTRGACSGNLPWAIAKRRHSHRRRRAADEVADDSCCHRCQQDAVAVMAACNDQALPAGNRADERTMLRGAGAQPRPSPNDTCILGSWNDPRGRA